MAVYVDWYASVSIPLYSYAFIFAQRHTDRVRADILVGWWLDIGKPNVTFTAIVGPVIFSSRSPQNQLHHLLATY